MFGQATTKLAAAAVPAAVAALLAAGCGGGGSDAPPQAKPPAPTPGDFARNVVRIPGRSGADVAAAAVLAAYPPGHGHPPNGWVLVPRDSWRAAVLGAQFAAHPLNAGVLPVAHDFIPTATDDVMVRSKPSGFPLSHGIQTLLIGDAGQDVFRGLHDLELNVAQLKAKTPQSLALRLAPYRGGFAHGYTSEVVVVSRQSRDYALPAAAWSAYSGDTIVFVDRDRVPGATQALLVQRKKLRAEKPNIYVVGPASVVSARVVGQLGQYGRVTRIAGKTPIDNAIAFARYRDPRTGFGWGLKRGPASVSLVDTGDWSSAVGAFDLAGAGPQAPLLLTSGKGGLPPQVLAYLTQLRGPKPNQGFVFGDPGAISAAAMRQLDAALAARR